MVSPVATFLAAWCNCHFEFFLQLLICLPLLTVWIVSYLYLSNRAASWAGKDTVKMDEGQTTFRYRLSILSLGISACFNMKMDLCLHECVHIYADGMSLDKDTEMKHGSWSFIHGMCKKNLKRPYRPYDFQRSPENPGIRGWYKTCRKGLCHTKVLSAWSVIWLLNSHILWLIALSPSIPGRHSFPMRWQRVRRPMACKELVMKAAKEECGTDCLETRDSGCSSNDLALTWCRGPWQRGWPSVVSLYHHHTDMSNDVKFPLYLT